MLSKIDVSKLNKCLLNDHLLLEAKLNVITKGVSLCTFI